MHQKVWTSPDGRIEKIVIIEGEWGKKPSEESVCNIKVTSCTEALAQYSDTAVTVGDNDGDMGRLLDKCLLTMNEGETADFTLVVENVSFRVNLCQVTGNNLIYKWDAQQKLEIALRHKEKGVTLFKQNKEKDAAYRFTKAMKIACSVPIDVQDQPEEVDGVLVKDITQLKANLFNNLASYYLKRQAWLMVIDMCKKVLSIDKDNVKAHYKIGVAYMKDKNFELAERAFEAVLQAEPGNRAAAEQLRLVKGEIQRAKVKFNHLVKKMFV